MGKSENDEISGGSGSGSGGGDEGSAEAGEGEEGPTSQEQEEQKQRLLFEQNRLSDRGAAEMVFLELAASRGGVIFPDKTALLLAYLAENRLTGFFMSLAGLVQNCSVLDLDTCKRSVFARVSTDWDKSGT